MPKVNRLAIPLSKVEYLLNYATGAGAGGDKRRFWREVMGFDSPEALRESLLAHTTVGMLQSDRHNAWGEQFRAVISMTSVSGTSWQIRTCWIVLRGEDVARFVTAFPERARRQP